MTLNTLLTGLRSPGVPSAAWDAIILTRTWQDLENFDWRIASGTLRKKNEKVREKNILFWNLQRSFVLQLNETIISTNVYCWYILLHFELPQIKAYENFKLITIFLIIRSWVQIPYRPEIFSGLLVPQLVTKNTYQQISVYPLWASFSTFNNTTSYLLITKLNKNVIATIASISSADSKAVIFKQKGWKKTSIQTFWALLCTDWIFNFEKTNSYCLVSTFLMIRFSLYI